jgi:peptidoglycan-N-acetylglucosamine deacetylase
VTSSSSTALVKQRAHAAVTLDVDGVRHYHAIHGLPASDGTSGDPCIELGVRRFLDLCERFDVKATIFVVTHDLTAQSPLAALLTRATNEGHEIASHSHAHAYDMSRHPADAIRDDVARTVAALEQCTGKRPRGFRAPGYNLSEAMLDALEANGFAYDSSVMPSALYWAARTLVIGARKYMGTPSSSIVGHARAFASRALRAPYRPRKGAYAKRARSRVDGRNLVEVPIATLPFGVPWLGTTLGMAPLPVGATSTAAALTTRAPVVLELHAIDLCEADDGFSPHLVRVQRELRVPLATKLMRLESAVRMLAQTRDVVTVEEIARAV